LPRLSRVVGKLADRRLVERLGDGADARVIHVHLTPEGRRALVRAVPGHIDLVRRLVIDELDEAQLEALASALEPLVARLDPQQRLGFGRHSS